MLNLIPIKELTVFLTTNSSQEFFSVEQRIQREQKGAAVAPAAHGCVG
jgi:hypothetical protein